MKEIALAILIILMTVMLLVSWGRIENIENNIQKNNMYIGKNLVKTEQRLSGLECAVFVENCKEEK